MKTTKTFEQQKKIAFTIILWIFVVFTLAIFSFLLYKREWIFYLMIGSLFILTYLIVWLNKRYFSMPKAFYRIDAKWRACNSRFNALQEIKVGITNNPSLTKMYMEEWGYYDEFTFKHHLVEEITRNQSKELKLRELLQQIKTTPEISFIAYMKKYLWR